MSIEAVPDTIHEYMYQKMKESRDSEEETKIIHVDRKSKYQKPEQKTNSEKSIVSDAAHRTGVNNTTARQKQRNAKCLNCGKIGHYAKLCRTKQKSDRKIKHIYPESEATSAQEDDWSINKRHLITRTVHSTKQITRDGQRVFTTTALVKNRPIKFIIDSGLPVT